MKKGILALLLLLLCYLLIGSIAPYTNWRSGVEHAAKLGVGSLEYELIEVR